jgi:glycosyltransferase involved in cell wall biosynthesis
MKIHFACNDGSPIDKLWEDIHGRGVGGAEYGLLSLAEQFVKDGHEVVIYNQAGGVEIEQAGIVFKNLNQVMGGDPDRILIAFRSPNDRIMAAKAEKKLWWSTDQHTIGSFKNFGRQVEFIITISPFHTDYHIKTYGFSPSKIGHIDLGVRDDYLPYGKVEKKKNMCIFCSVPDRGLHVLYQSWGRIKSAVPDATLVITSDYRLWGLPSPNNHKHRLMWATADGVSFLGKVSRDELVTLQMSAEILSYPSTYEELFCVSVAECGVAGAYPVTSTKGAVPTTNQWGTSIIGDPTRPEFIPGFAGRIISLLTDDREFLESQQKIMMKEARERFSWERIAKKWYRLFEDGRI